MAHSQGEPAGRPRAGGRRRRVAFLAVWVAIVVLAVSVAEFFVARVEVSRHDDYLLQADTDQIATYLDSSLTNVSNTLNTFAASTLHLRGSIVGFQAEAEKSARGPLSLALAENVLGSYLVLSEAGPGFHVGAKLDPTVAVALQNAPTTGPADVVNRQDGGILTSWAGPPAVPQGFVVGARLALGRVISQATANPLAHGLRVSLYDGSTPHAPALVATLHGGTRPGPGAALAHFSVGGTNWVVAVSTAQPIIGAFAASTPLVVLLLGVFVALSGALLIVVVAARRRRPDAVSDTMASDVAPAPPPAVPVAVAQGDDGPGALDGEPGGTSPSRVEGLPPPPPRPGPNTIPLGFTHPGSTRLRRRTSSPHAMQSGDLTRSVGTKSGGSSSGSPRRPSATMASNATTPSPAPAVRNAPPRR